MPEFKLNILSTRDEVSTNSKCYICEASLEDYINSIPNRYTDYDVQRGIVGNVYLDRITHTIMEGKYIPPIVLIAEKHNDNPKNLIVIEEYKILDGLQRTYRIKSVYNALQIYIDKINNGEDFTGFTKYRLSKKYKKILEENDTTATILWTIKSIVDKENYDLVYLKSIFSNFIQWFEVWIGLDKKEQINKMLILNAGHKPMDLKHQLELLFLNVIPGNYLKNFVRAKEVNSSYFYKNKKLGQLHLSHFISALLSFEAEKPITVDAKYLKNLQDNLDTELERLKVYFEEESLNLLIDFTKKLDVIFHDKYNKIGLEWLGRETILIGLFSSFGRYYGQNKEQKSLEQCFTDIHKILENNIDVFQIEEFNLAKTTSIDITKVNIGNIFKYTTYNATCQLLLKNNTDINWDVLFKYGSRMSDECK